MASSTGWVKLHRKFKESDIFNDPELLRLWLLCLMKASHSTREVTIQGERVELEPGQFLTGRSALYSDYNEGMPKKYMVKDTTLWNRLKKLESMGSLTIENLPSRKASVITLNNWDEHQTEEKSKKKPKRAKKEEDPKAMEEFIKAGEDKELETLPEKKKKGKRIYTKEDVEYKLASRLFYWMLQNNPKARKPDPQKWADVVRLMIERDNRTPEEIKLYIDWSQNHSFWKGNILSTQKLRDQFDKLIVQYGVEQEKKQKAQARFSSGRNGKKNDLLRDMMEREARNEQGGNNKTLYLD